MNFKEDSMNFLPMNFMDDFMENNYHFLDISPWYESRLSRLYYFMSNHCSMISSNLDDKP
jgi:hypothetical protein